jgi:hypothetical protein
VSKPESTSERSLTLSIHAVLLWVLRALPGQEVAQTLYLQSMVASIAAGPPTMLELAVPLSCEPAAVPDGPLPVRAVAVDGQGLTLGEVLVWVSNGYLSAIEYAWYTDEAPTELPATSQLRQE